MTNTDIYYWESQIRRLEQQARLRPGLYRFKVTCFACLPGFYISLVLLISVAILIGLGSIIFWLFTNFHGLAALKILIPAVLGTLGFIVTLGNALFVAVDEPTGIEITREEATPLFLEIDRLRQQLNVPRFHRVFLDDNFNAGVRSVPRYGIFGGHRSYLVIGIPLMASLSPNHFRAVLAHEMGHIADGHGRFGSWIYQIYQAWMYLLYSLESEDRASILLFEGFFLWFAPRLEAYTFVARRMNEYEADRLAAKAVGAETLAGALIATSLADIALQTNHHGPVERKTAQQWLNACCNVRSGYEDVHPSLTDRLRALNQKPRLPEPVEETALFHYFRHRTPMLLQRVGYQVVFASGEEGSDAVPPPPKPDPVPVAPVPSATGDPLRPLGS